MNNTEISLADIIDDIKKDPVQHDVENKIKTLINEFQAKTFLSLLKKKVD